MRDCEGEIHLRARQGIKLFNQRCYFEAHEELEAAWRAEEGNIRRLYQGILEAGVVYLHIQRQNLAGALKVYQRSMRLLDEWPDICRGIHIGQLRRDLQGIIMEAGRLGSGRLAEIDPQRFRPITLEEGPRER